MCCLVDNKRFLKTRVTISLIFNLSLTSNQFTITAKIQTWLCCRSSRCSLTNCCRLQIPTPCRLLPRPDLLACHLHHLQVCPLYWRDHPYRKSGHQRVLPQYKKSSHQWVCHQYRTQGHQWVCPQYRKWGRCHPAAPSSSPSQVECWDSRGTQPTADLAVSEKWQQPDGPEVWPVPGPSKKKWTYINRSPQSQSSVWDWCWHYGHLWALGL